MTSRSSGSEAAARLVEVEGQSARGLAYTIIRRSDFLGCSPAALDQRRVLYLHGWTQSQSCWRTTARRVCSLHGLPGLLIDFPGHGKSRPFEAEGDFAPTAKNWLRPVFALLDELGWYRQRHLSRTSGTGSTTCERRKNISVVGKINKGAAPPKLTIAGCSMGARVAMEMYYQEFLAASASASAVEDPERFDTASLTIDRLVILATPGYPEPISTSHGEQQTRFLASLPHHLVYRPLHKLTEMSYRSFKRRKSVDGIIGGSSDSPTSCPARPLSRAAESSSRSSTEIKSSPSTIKRRASEQVTNLLGHLSMPRQFPTYGLEERSPSSRRMLVHEIIDSLKTCQHVALIHGNWDLPHRQRFDVWAGGRPLDFHRKVGLLRTREMMTRRSSVVSDQDEKRVSAVEYEW